MAIVVQEVPELTRREELQCEIAILIEESIKSDQDVSPYELAALIMDILEDEPLNV